MQEIASCNLRIYKEGQIVKIVPGQPLKHKLVYDSYFAVKNLQDSKSVLWMASSDLLVMYSLQELKITQKMPNMWELENGSLQVDPIQAVIMRKPYKLLCLFKVKAESQLRAKKTIVKTFDLEKSKQKIYEMDEIVPGCSLS